MERLKVLSETEDADAPAAIFTASAAMDEYSAPSVTYYYWNPERETAPAHCSQDAHMSDTCSMCSSLCITPPPSLPF